MPQKFFAPVPLPNQANWAVLILRIGFASLMLVYGYGKLERYLNGERGFADPIGLGEETTLLLAIFSEFFCPIFLIFGLWTRAALIPLILTMLVAFFIIHSGDPWDKQEHPLVFLIPYIALFLTGPGRFSLDHRLYAASKPS
ncbi:MAG: DoxX family protein [Bacteroidetes bacterium]|nr:DoxX family protein [Bacteroidota bacterium]